MAKKDTVKEYTRSEITVIWKPDLCIHSGVCVEMLPDVYNPEERPWVKPENASTEELMNQINKCPSGALSYRMNGEENTEVHSVETKVEVMENGPLIVYGTLRIKNARGKEEVKNKTTAFCRCGASKNKPYCDGAHIKTNFQPD